MRLDCTLDFTLQPSALPSDTKGGAASTLVAADASRPQNVALAAQMEASIAMGVNQEMSTESARLRYAPMAYVSTCSCRQWRAPCARH